MVFFTAVGKATAYIVAMQQSIVREIRGTSFVYERGGKAIKDKHELERIASLVIPPAWRDVTAPADPQAEVAFRGCNL